jgi:hypothetical protein
MENLDWVKLASEMTKDSGKVPYDTNKHLFTKVAFDVFQLNGSSVESLWKLENDEDGKQFLVAMYDDEQEGDKIVSTSNWSALSDKNGQNITLFYKDTPIQRFASVEYGFNNEDAHVFQNALVSKLNSDKEFSQKLVRAQNEQVKSHLLNTFPELA